MIVQIMDGPHARLVIAIPEETWVWRMYVKSEIGRYPDEGDGLTAQTYHEIASYRIQWCQAEGQWQGWLENPISAVSSRPAPTAI